MWTHYKYFDRRCAGTNCLGMQASRFETFDVPEEWQEATDTLEDPNFSDSMFTVPRETWQRVLYTPVLYIIVIIYTHRKICLRRTRYPRGLRRRSAAARLLRLWVRIPPGHGRVFHVSVVCCQVVVSATGRSHVQRSPTDCACVCVCLMFTIPKCLHTYIYIYTYITLYLSNTTIFYYYITV